MSEHYLEDNLWSDLLLAERQFSNARGRLLAAHASLHDVLDPALRDPAQRRSALRFLQTLDEPTRREYFPTLIGLASVGHVDIALVRDVILSLDREWLSSAVWAPVEERLHAEATDEEYRRYAELLRVLDPKLLGRLVELALSSGDEDTREVGEDFRRYVPRG